MTVLIVTGTDTGVGKTVTTAALHTFLNASGTRVATVKPVQTGTSGDEPSDAATVARLSGSADVAELCTLEDPLAPDSAARLRGIDIPTVAELATRISHEFAAYDVVLVEGAGGVLVRLDTAGGTLLDLADGLISAGHRVLFVIVTSIYLGTLNHTELTIRAVQQRGLDIAGLVIGSIPEQLDLAAERNLIDLGRVTQLPILAQIPAGAGGSTPEDFETACPGWFSQQASELFAPP